MLEPRLRDLPARLAASGHIVGWRAGQAVLARDYAAEIAGAAAALTAYPARPVALWHEDALTTGAWLLAALTLGRDVYLPGELSSNTRGLLRTEHCLFVGTMSEADLAVSVPAGGDVVLGEACGRVLIFTSGSTGEPAAIAKQVFQLDAELAALEASLGAALPADCTIAGSVPHQHFYGLLFRLLWPLASGRPVLAQALQHPESLWLAQAYRDWAFVGSPAFLKRLPDNLDWAQLAPPCVVFSSGGALPAEVNLTIRERLRCTVTEIYGSSETGGVAFRRASDGDWTPLVGVAWRLGEDACLHVRSPWTAASEGFQTADRVQLEAGRMRLLGRADRLAKVEDKRISLSRIEAILRAQAEVREARAVLLEGARTEVGVVLVLSDAGHSACVALGKRGMDRLLRDRLTAHIEAVGLPRRWRHVAALPQNALGKITEAALLALFARRLPRVLQERRDVASLELDLAIDEDLLYFDGHFPAFPVLPGVVQLDWAMHFARAAFAMPPDCLQLESVKFQQMIRPGALVRLSLVFESVAGLLRFAFDSEAGRHASGRIRVGSV